MKIKALLLVALLSVSIGFAQKRPERPKVHSEFYFGSYPSSRTAADLVAKENAKLLLVAYHEGWDTEKTAKELKLSLDDLHAMFDELEEQELAGERTEYNSKPFMPVIRERDIDRIKSSLDTHAREYARLLQSNWAEIESLVDSFASARGVPKPQALYQVVVSGLLMGGMEEALYEDKTLMPPGPRRANGQRFYAWLVEGDSELAGTLKREVRESDGYRIVSVGTSFPADRATLDAIRTAPGIVLDDAESRRFRSFVAIFSRDKLLPFFKAKRSDLLRLGGQIDAGKYVAFAEFFAWYHNQLVNMVTKELVQAGRIAAPAEQYTYAFRAAQ